MRMRSASLILIALAGPHTAAPKADANERLVTLEVSPKAVPAPALKYLLLPDLSEQQPGNAVPIWLMCFAEQNTFFFKKEQVEERDRLLKTPLTDIKPGSLKNYGGSALLRADRAARLEYADWNLIPEIREKGYNLLLPELQQMRTLANALAVKARGQVVDKDYDGAVRSLATIFSLARHLGEHPTLISGLVGIAIAQVGLNVLEDLIQQPEAPNLYWALATLPTNLVEFRRAMGGERILLEAGLGTLADPSRVWRADDIPRAVRALADVGLTAELTAAERKSADQWLRDRRNDEAWLKDARKYLTDHNYPAAAVEKYPPEQVLFNKLVLLTRVQRDEGLKLLFLPYATAMSAYAELDKPAASTEEKLAKSVMVSISKVRTAQARLEQRFALLRVVEAARLETAKNGGKLPKDLGTLSVPVPGDPISGRPFAYTVESATQARIEGAATPGGAGQANRYKYEIRLRK